MKFCSLVNKTVNIHAFIIWRCICTNRMFRNSIDIFIYRDSSLAFLVPISSYHRLLSSIIIVNFLSYFPIIVRNSLVHFMTYCVIRRRAVPSFSYISYVHVVICGKVAKPLKYKMRLVVH